ncbi:MAG: hypothetical protein ABFS37_11795 [Acidobacteriota bacterium]
MREHRRIRLTFVSGMLVLAANWGQVFASEPEAYPVSEWTIDIIDDESVVGYFVSAATDPVSGETFISYYEGIDGDLWLARSDPPGAGNCGPGDTWECQVVDSAGVVGKYSSIAVGGPGPVANLFISYYDVTNGSLKVLEGTVDRATGSLSYSTNIIEAGDTTEHYYVGTRTAVVVDALFGWAHIGYQVRNPNSEHIRYTKRVVQGTGNCGEGAAANAWECDTIHIGTNVGEFIDIDMLDESWLHMAFIDADESYTFPVLARKVGAGGGNCNGSDSWVCAPIRLACNDIGEWVSLVVGGDGSVHLAYSNSTMDTVEWATNVTSGTGNCGSGSYSWDCRWIDDVGSPAVLPGIDIETDDDFNPIIVYQVEEGWDVNLKIARPLEALSWPASGNCGPLSPSYFPTWRCETLDVGGVSYAHAAGGLSIAMNGNGDAAVAYRSLDLYTDEGFLKVAMEPASIFTDGFESGDTSRWSGAVP